MTLPLKNVSLIYTGNPIETHGLVLKKNLSQKNYMEIWREVVEDKGFVSIFGYGSNIVV